VIQPGTEPMRHIDVPSFERPPGASGSRLDRGSEERKMQ
jgi:hypothetical protein